MDQKPVVYIIDPNPSDRKLVEETAEGQGAASQWFASAEAFLETADLERPGCVVSELRLLGMNGLLLQQELLQRAATLPVVFLATLPETRITVSAMLAGAVTVLEKPVRPQELWDAVYQALVGNRKERQRVERLQDSRRRLRSLTVKERDVLALILDGVPNKGIARRLDISVRTVETRRAQIFRKTATRSVAELVRLTLDAPDRGASGCGTPGWATSDRRLKDIPPRADGDDGSVWRRPKSRQQHGRVVPR